MGLHLLNTHLLGIDISVGDHVQRKVFGLTLDMDIIWATIVAGLVVITMGLLMARKATSGVPGKFQLVWEMAVGAVQKQVDDRAAKEGLSDADMKRRMLIEKQPSGEFATPEQIGQVTAFLCSDAAKQTAMSDKKHFIESPSRRGCHSTAKSSSRLWPPPSHLVYGSYPGPLQTSHTGPACERESAIGPPREPDPRYSDH